MSSNQNEFKTAGDFTPKQMAEEPSIEIYTDSSLEDGSYSSVSIYRSVLERYQGELENLIETADRVEISESGRDLGDFLESCGYEKNEEGVYINQRSL